VNHPETEIQIAVADLLRLYEKKRGFLFFAVINEAFGKSKTGAGLATMARYKKMGMVPGVSDLVICKDGETFFLELKSKDGKQSEKQIDFECEAARVGCAYALAYSVDGAIKALKGWGVIP